MKRKFLLFAIFIVGTFIGFVSCFLLLGSKGYSALSHFTSLRLMEMAVDVRELRAGQADRILERYDEAIPQLILQFDKFYTKGLPQEQINSTLWAFQRYYSDNSSLEIPAEIKPILEALPPRPLTSCEIKPLEEKDKQSKDE